MYRLPSMTNTVVSDIAPASGGAGNSDVPCAALPGWVLPVLLGGGGLIAIGTWPTERSRPGDRVQRGLGLLAFGVAVLGVRRNRPAKRTAWWLIVGSLGLFVLGDIVFDTLAVTGGSGTRLPLRRHPLSGRLPVLRGRPLRRVVRGVPARLRGD